MELKLSPHRGVSSKHLSIGKYFAALFLIISFFAPATESYAASNQATSSSQSINAGEVIGIVVDDNGAPIIGATVMVQGTSNGTITDVDGKYRLRNVDNNAIINYSYIGYATQSLPYNGKTAIDVTLKPDNLQIDNIVVVGFGSQKKTHLTGAVSVVDSKVLEDRPVSNVADMLQGSVPGLNISNSAGSDMDASASINIRGTGTIGTGSKGDPLILIDGMEGDFNSLNPQDVESISVLKDAASSSIYGSRAPFGVILITTKQGKKGDMKVNYSSNLRFSTPRGIPDMTDSYSFALGLNDGMENAGNTPWASEARLQQILAYKNGELPSGTLPSDTDPNVWAEDLTYGFGYTNHYDDAYVDWAFSHEHNVSIQGGTEKLNVYASANYSDQTGFIEVNPDTVTRFTNTVKVNSQLYDWLKLSYSSRYSNRDYNYPTYLTRKVNNQYYFFQNLSQNPTTANFDPNGFPMSSDSGQRPIFSLSENGDSNKRSESLYQQVQLTIEPIKNWKTFFDYNFKSSTTATTAQVKNSYNTGVDGVTKIVECRDSYVEEYRYNGAYQNINLYSEYSKEFDTRHAFKAMVGFQSESNDYGDVKMRRDGLIVPDLICIDTTNGLAYDGAELSPAMSGKYMDWATAGFFGRLNYDYDGKYLVEANLRYDGTSRFRGDYRWGLFPSASLGWNIAKESFFEPLQDKIGNLKFRASYGELGNQNTSLLYPTYRTLDIKTNSGAHLLDGSKPTYVAEPGLIDPSLTWERIASWDIGLDLSAFDNRLNVTADYFIRSTTDMVGPAPELPAVLGIGVPKQNNTNLTTKGYEIAISWRDRLDNGFSYGVSASLSDGKTIIDSYPNATQSLDPKLYISGRPVGEIWGYETIGIAKSQEEMDQHLANFDQSALGGGWSAGDIMYRDLNGDGAISQGKYNVEDSGDLKVIGNNSPRYAVSFSFDTSYKGFDLKAFFQGIMKRDYWLGESTYFWGFASESQFKVLSTVDALDYFREDPSHPLGQNLDSYLPRPIFSAPGASKNQQTQSRYLQDASYLRLKNLQVGYTLPRSVTEKIGIGNCRFYLSGENLWTITKLSSIYDPETIGGGYYGSAYPQATVLSMGVNLTF